MQNFYTLAEFIDGTQSKKIDGCWIIFEESNVRSISYKRGAYIEEIDSFDDPTIEMVIEVTERQPSFAVHLSFQRCSFITMDYFNHENTIYTFTTQIEHRGFYIDGKTPLPPEINVEIGNPKSGLSETTGTYHEKTFSTSFKCYEIKVLEVKENIANS